MEKNTSRSNVREKVLSYLSLRESNVSRPELENLIFKSSTNIRLTYQGNRYMSRYFDSYPYPHNINTLSKHLIGLSRDMNFPYYFSDKMLVLYSEVDAMMVNLHGGVDNYFEYLSLGV